MIKIKLEIIREEFGGVSEVKEKKTLQIPLTWLNPFRRHRRKPNEEAVEAISAPQAEDEDERPEGWIHPPLP